MTHDPISATACDAFRARAERGLPRGATDVLASARAAAAVAPAPASATTSMRRRTLAAAIVGVAAGAGALAIGARPDDAGTAAADEPFCAALSARGPDAASAGGDVLVYFDVGAAPQDRAFSTARIRALVTVASAREIDPAAMEQRVDALFEPEVAALVDEDDLPALIEVDAIDPERAAELIAQVEGLPAVWAVEENHTGRARVLDLLVWPGHNPHVRAGSGQVDLANQPYGPRWEAKAQAVRDAAPASTVAAIDALRARLHREVFTADDLAPSAAGTADAAQLAAEAEARCGLEPDPYFARVPDAGTTATTEARTDHATTSLPD